jgi:hypothetical protein
VHTGSAVCTFESLQAFQLEGPKPKQIRERFGKPLRERVLETEKHGRIEELHYGKSEPEVGACRIVVLLDSNTINYFTWSPGLGSPESRIENALKLFPDKRFTSKRAPWIAHYQPAELYYTSTDRQVTITVNTVRKEVQTIGLSPLPDGLSIAEKRREPTSEHKAKPKK